MKTIFLLCIILLLSGCSQHQFKKRQREMQKPKTSAIPCPKGYVCYLCDVSDGGDWFSTESPKFELKRELTRPKSR